ncbi:MAG: hypothetical protein GDA49_04690 [Rhodospirillales bacterium]|nr:hypothetical protein [Rhodospirillales bacterium]
MPELARRWMESGQVETFERIVREEATAWQAIAADRLEGFELKAHPASFHTWLTLPEPWRPTDFAREAERQGVIVTPAEAFAIGRDTVPFAVRLSLTGPMTRDDLVAGLDIVARLARNTPSALSIVIQDRRTVRRPLSGLSLPVPKRPCRAVRNRRVRP